LVPIDFPYTTFYGLPIVTFARTHRLVTIHFVQTDDKQTTDANP